METERPRLLSSRPMLAAVMPLPTDDVTPPVTKTYFANGPMCAPGVCQMLAQVPARGKPRRLPDADPGDPYRDTGLLTG